MAGARTCDPGDRRKVAGFQVKPDWARITGRLDVEPRDGVN